MARQPLNSRFRQAGLGLGPGFLAERPEAAALIAEVIATWTEVELQTGLVLAEMLGTNSEPAVALYLSLANARAKREALDAVAEYIFDEEQKRLYNAIMTAKLSLEKQRSFLAHGLLGITDDPTGIVAISTADRIKHVLFGRTKEQSGIRPTASDLLKFKDYVFHYSIDDLKELLKEVKDLHSILIWFISLLIARYTSAP
jgi:hypothetical protein